MKKSMIGASAVMLMALGATQVAAQSDNLVRASNPEGMLSALKDAGYDPELASDGAGDPMITLTLSNANTAIVFYDCTENKDCQSIQFSAGFDRDDPWSPEEAIKLSTDYRYMAVRLDEEGDPFIRWDVEIGDGMPKPLFLRSVLRFTESIEIAKSIIFAE